MACLDGLPSELLVVVLSMVPDGASLRNARATSRVLMETIDTHVVKALSVNTFSGVRRSGQVGTERGPDLLVDCLTWASGKWPGLRSLTIMGVIPGSWLVAVCRQASGCRPLLQRLTSLTLLNVMLPRNAAAALAAALPATCATITVQLFDAYRCSCTARCCTPPPPRGRLHRALAHARPMVQHSAAGRAVVADLADEHKRQVPVGQRLAAGTADGL
jgi:hypothetical protein